MTPRFNLLTPEHVNIYWPNISEWFMNNPEMWTGWSLPAIYGLLQSQTFNAWALLDDDGIQVVVITHVVSQPARRVLWVRFAFGRKIDTFLPMSNEWFDQVAEMMGCDCIFFTGRRGWVKRLERFGWKEESINMVRLVGAKRKAEVQ